MSHVEAGFKGDLDAAKKIRLPWWVLLPGVIVAAFSAALFDQFAKLYLVLPVLNTIAILGFLVALKWKLRTRMWFWITMLIFAVLHVPLILFIPWTTMWVPALAIAAIDSADFYVILWVLSVVEKFMRGSEASEM